MDEGIRYSIGELARRTGLSVRTIRFYSDLGVVPPTDRSPAGYRQYDLNALARLDLVRKPSVPPTESSGRSGVPLHHLPISSHIALFAPSGGIWITVGSDGQ